MNLVRHTISDKQGSSCLLRKTKRRRKWFKKKKAHKREQRWRSKGGACSRDWGRQEPHIFSLILQWNTHVVVFTQFIWSSPHRGTLQILLPQLVTLAMLPFHPVTPQTFPYFKAFIALQKSNSDKVKVSWLKTRHHDHNCNVTEQLGTNQHPNMPQSNHMLTIIYAVHI